MKKLLTITLTLIFAIIVLHTPAIAGKRQPSDGSLEITGTLTLGVDSKPGLYNPIKQILTKAYCTNDHFAGLRMNKNQQTFHCLMEDGVAIRNGLKKDDYTFSYDIHFSIEDTSCTYRVSNFRFCLYEKVKNDENCTLLQAVSYSGKNKTKLEKQMKTVALTRAQHVLEELLTSLGQISQNMQTTAHSDLSP